jgi:hypothetical protein
MAQVSVTEQTETKARLSGLEKLLLLVPMLAGLFFGLAPLLEAKLFAHLGGYVGADNDIIIYWLAGAATLGYGITLALGIREGGWIGMRLPVVAVLVFNLCSLFACEEEIRLGRASDHLITYLILASSIVFCVMTSFILARHRGAPRGEPDTATWFTIYLVIAVIAAFSAGLLALFFPEQFKPIFGLNAQDVFVYRQLGAATTGYAIMGILQLRSRRWLELRLSLIMAAIFNVLAVGIGFTALLNGAPPRLPITMLITPVIAGVGAIVAVVRKGK